MLFAVIDLLLRATLRVIAMRWASARARLTGADVPNFHAQILLHNAATYRPSVARPWDSKLPPIDYERCCSDQLNPHPKSRHREFATRPGGTPPGLVLDRWMLLQFTLASAYR